MATLRGTLDHLLDDPALSIHEVRVTVTDRVRPTP